MVSASDAFWIGVSTFRVRAYGTRILLANLLDGSTDRAARETAVVAHRRANRAWERSEPALRRIDGLLDRNGLRPLPSPTPSASGKWATALHALVKANVAAGSIAAAANDLGAFASDVETAAASVADVLEAGPHGFATARLRAERDGRVASLEAAVYCLDETLVQAEPLLRSEELSPSVGEAADALRACLATVPAPGARGMESWLDTLEERLRRLGVALAFPPEPSRLDPPSDEERALVAAILADPAAEPPRRAFAELAGKRRDPRAALVREQLATSAGRRGASYPVNDSELTRDLLRRHPEWSDEVRGIGATDVHFVRGFVEEISIDAGLFLENAEALFRVAPIRGVQLTSAALHVATIAASPRCGRLVSLGFPNGGLDDSHVVTLAASANLRGLLSLDLTGNAVTDDGLRAIAASPNLTALIQCVTTGNPCSVFYESDWSHQEIPSLEWLPTAFCAAMEAAYGRRRWFRRADRTLGLDELS